MNINKKHIIKSIKKGSIADQLSLEPGDEVLRINGKKIKDVFDYHYYTNEEYLVLLVKKKNNEEWELEIEKEYEEDLGIDFCEGLMDSYRSCRNKCIFCFIDQMPPGMRETLYFKDDDARLSFLQGNYITLTNMSDEDVERICFYKLSPINISIHTMNPELRCKMLNNRFAGEALKKLEKFAAAELTMNSQIVLCKGWNDGDELDFSIQKLIQYFPYMQSLSVVPAGMTKYREGLTKLEKFSKEDSLKIIETIEGWQKKFLKKFGTRFVFASDEWYISAGKEIPSEEYYEGYKQIENGVGMVRSLIDEFDYALKNICPSNKIKTVSLCTGVLASPIMNNLFLKIKDKFPNIKVLIYTIYNDFFGRDITVAGLLTGQDIIAQLKGKELGEYLIMPQVMLRSGEEVLLDDLTVSDIEKALQTKIHIVESDGMSLLNSVVE